MSGKFLLDTNTVIAIFSGNASVKDRLRQADEVFISSIVLGELYFGAYKSSNVENNLKRIDDFAASCTVISCDKETAHEYGSIKYQLREKGTPIPENDIWISAIALQHDLVLVTGDKHFDDVEDLKHERW